MRITHAKRACRRSGSQPRPLDSHRWNLISGPHPSGIETQIPRFHGAFHHDSDQIRSNLIEAAEGLTTPYSAMCFSRNCIATLNVPQCINSFYIHFNEDALSKG